MMSFPHGEYGRKRGGGDGERAGGQNACRRQCLRRGKSSRKKKKEKPSDYGVTALLALSSRLRPRRGLLRLRRRGLHPQPRGGPRESDSRCRGGSSGDEGRRRKSVLFVGLPSLGLFLLLRLRLVVPVLLLLAPAAAHLVGGLGSAGLLRARGDPGRRGRPSARAVGARGAWPRGRRGPGGGRRRRRRRERGPPLRALRLLCPGPLRRHDGRRPRRGRPRGVEAALVRPAGEGGAAAEAGSRSPTTRAAPRELAATEEAERAAAASAAAAACSSSLSRSSSADGRRKRGRPARRPQPPSSVASRRRSGGQEGAAGALSFRRPPPPPLLRRLPPLLSAGSPPPPPGAPSPRGTSSPTGPPPRGAPRSRACGSTRCRASSWRRAAGATRGAPSDDDSILAFFLAVSHRVDS